MTMARFSSANEHKLAGIIDDVTRLVESGESPTDAVFKVATAKQLSRGHVTLVAHAYNNGATRHHLGNAESCLSKASAFPLVDLPKVLDRMFPEKPKTAATKFHEEAVSPEYQGARELPLLV